MSQKVGRLQQENAKLREEIKKLKGALKDVNQEIIQEVPILKPKRERSPISTERKKVIRDEIDQRLNYVIPTSAILKQKPLGFNNSPKSVEPEAFVASFGQEEPQVHLENTGKNCIHDTLQSELSEKMTVSNKDTNEFDNLSIEIESIIENAPDSPEFEKKESIRKELPKERSLNNEIFTKEIKSEGNVALKESFSSYYIDDSMSRVINEKDLEENQEKVTIKPKEEVSKNVKIPEKTKIDQDSEEGISTERPKNSIGTQNFNEKILVSEIEALRRENLKLRLQLNTSSKKTIKRSRSKSKTKSKSPNRKCKSRSITPRDRSSRPIKRNISTKSFNIDLELTPRRNRHCNTCDHLLSKGYSTKYCSKHGNAKLNTK